MDEVAELCDRILVLKNGSIIANNTPEQLAQSISKTHVHLQFSTSDFTKAINYFKSTGITYAAQANTISIELDEHMIALFLTNLSKHEINYTHIAIDKPTLKDYFLSIAK